MLIHTNRWKVAVLASALICMVGSSAHADDRSDENKDFGVRVEQILEDHAKGLFGVREPLEASAPETSGPYRTPTQRASDQVLAARGLDVEYLTRTAANATDMMALFPAADPSHLITCVEGGRQTLNNGKFNPSVQRIHLRTGTVETILRGMTSCDGIRTTPWGTILATEETTTGGAYEILDPLTTTEQSVLDRATGTVSDPGHIAKRTALPTMAWEGIAVLPSGAVIAGDELRPGTSIADSDGGAIFKFIPAVPRTAPGTISNLNDSPLTSGSVYALQVLVANNQFGQGGEIGRGRWIAVNAATARRDADTNGATGYYRPEDLHQDPMFVDATNPLAVRVCWADTGNEDFSNYAEVMCGVDANPDSPSSTMIVNRLVEGDADFNSFDNLDFQPVTGNLYVIEDHDNGDIFACLRDGADRDIKTDGCVKILSVKDTSAEPTGFLFSEDGRTAYLSIQHSDDANMPLVDGYGTDDVLKITGFRVKH
jgi:secreted PhoX family phosphatase